jgi:hypothetical protein
MIKSLQSPETDMKNYVVWTNCRTSETEEKFGIKPCGDPASQAAYNTMFQISHASAKKFLGGAWESIVFTDPSPTRVEMFKSNWQRIWNIWHQQPCNILYLDSDTMFFRPTEIFGKFFEFRLFNWTDPKKNSRFSNYYNAGVRYYPNSIKEEIWNIGKEMAENWDLNIWDQEQLIFNEMFWRQNVSDPHHPELNWQGMRMIIPDPRMQKAHETWNECPIEKVHIVHVAGSRNPTHTAQLMSRTAKQLGIEV